MRTARLGTLLQNLSQLLLGTLGTVHVDPTRHARALVVHTNTFVRARVRTLSLRRVLRTITTVPLILTRTLRVHTSAVP